MLKVIKAAAKDALVELLGRPLRVWEDWDTFFDPNDWRAQQTDLQGLWFTPLATTKAGRRNGTRESIREVQSRFPDNLTVKTNALATRVLFDGDNTAVGVEYLAGAHLYRADPKAGRVTDGLAARRVSVEREVILSAGAFNTPQLLKLSGVGPREELTTLGIDVRVDLPGVGENLQDRYKVGVVYEMRSDFALLEDCAFKPPRPGQKPDPCFEEWKSGRGVYNTNGVALAMIEKLQRAQDPDLFIFGLPGYFRGYYPRYSEEVERERNRFTWAILKAHTLNTAGKVTLRSDEPRDVPHVNFHYFDEGNDASGDDLEAVVEGVEFARRMMSRSSEVIERELVPGESVNTLEQIRKFVRNEAWGHHASCTCKLEPKGDEMAVVDSDFRVHGTTNLRVVDASVFPRIPGFFIVTAVYMVGEKASDVILADVMAGPGFVRRMFRRVTRRGTLG